MDYNEYSELKSIIDYHMDRYYNQDSPEISDYEYDQMMQKLKQCEKEHPEWITPDSPTQKIGGIAKREAGVKVTHDVPMLSIEDVFSKEDVVSWVRKVKEIHPDCIFSVEAKIDGLSMTLRYEKDSNGMLRLVLAETRGDGVIGEDVTENAKVIPDVKRYMDLPYDSLQLRGEVYMSHKDFERYNQDKEAKGEDLAANPRNLAAGTLRQLDPAITKERGLKFFVFNIQQGPNEIMVDHCESMDILSQVGIPVVYHKKCLNEHEILDAIDEIAEKRGDFDFDIDGAVVKIAQIAYRNDFPAGSKYSSGHIAYKYPPEERNIVMDDILVNVGRTGKLTFTGVFYDKETGKAARLCGTNVSRATLHNQDYIDEMNIGIGGVYRLYKSGEIIPKLNGCVEKPVKPFKAPNICPVCGETLQREKDTADIRCFNPFCHSQLARTLLYFVSLDAMNIMGLGETIVEDLVRKNVINSFSDFYHLQDFEEKLNPIIGKERTKKILQEIEKSKDRGAVRLLTGFGIRNVGKNTAKTLMKHFESIEELQNSTFEQLVEIEDVGDITARCIREFFDNHLVKDMIADLKTSGVSLKSDTIKSVSDKLAGLIFVVTGTLPTLGRKEITELIESNGGKCTGSVSKKTNYLVVGEEAGSKLTKAQELGIPTLSEDDFMAMIN